MPRPDLTLVPPFFHNYVNQTTEADAQKAIEANSKELFALLETIPDSKWVYRYADRKWSIKEMVQHLIDAERVFGYRALCIARGEKASLPGFDENEYAAASKADLRSSEELLSELKTLRQSTEQLFASFDEEQLAQTGISNGKSISANSIGFIIAGHAQHHVNVLNERYL